MTVTAISKNSDNKAPADLSRAKKINWFGWFWQFMAAAAAGVFLLEAYFRVAGVGGQEFLEPDAVMGCRHIPNKKVIWRLEGYSDEKLNSVGLRDTEHAIGKAAGVYRIALLGDSAVESLQVNLNDTFGKVLEGLLNQCGVKAGKAKAKKFEVINFGCSSYSTGQEVLQYEQQVRQYKPDLVVLLYNRGDSLENVLKAKDRKRAEIRPYFYLEQRVLKQDNSILLANADKLAAHPLKDFMRRYSTVYGALNQADFALTLNEPRYRKIKSWWQALVSLPSKFAQKDSRQKPPPYLDQEDMRVTRALLERLEQDTKQDKCKLLLTVFPNTVNYKILSQQAQEIEYLARQKNCLFLDLSRAFLACSDPSSNFIQYHFSKKGHALVAYELMNVIEQQIKP